MWRSMSALRSLGSSRTRATQAAAVPAIVMSVSHNFFWPQFHTVNNSRARLGDEFCEFICATECCVKAAPSAKQRLESSSVAPLTCAAAHQYNATGSNTGSPVGTDTWAAFFGDSRAYGDTAIEYVELGKTQTFGSPILKLPKATVGLATEVTGVFTRDASIDGVLGFSKINTVSAGAPSLLE